ncbi:MAG: methyltransferase domain-containing protein [Rhodocyclales bacterium]|nr:methyltransferase domain-containing protein [Rhodocyclales bacterium]
METTPLPNHDQPSDWVRRFAPLIPAGGKVLDLACGKGRHARLLATLGYAVEAVDRNADNLAGLAGSEGISVHQADLEGGPWPYYGFAFDGIVVTNYLHRPLMPNILGALAVGGVLVYETFMQGNERFGKPADPAYLLRPGELLEIVRKRFAVVAFEQGEVAAPRPAVIQRICVRRGEGARLPEH